MRSGRGDEPDTYLGALAAVIRELDEYRRTVASCLGAGRPALLNLLHRWLAPCERVVDVGAGLGGPARLLQSRRSRSLVLIEPDGAAADHAADLTGLTVVRAGGDRMPLEDRSADGAMCLGVLSATHEPGPVIRETARVLRPGGRLGLWVFTARGDARRATSQGRFPGSERIHDWLGEAGLLVGHAVSGEHLHPDPDWERILRSARRTLAVEFGHLTSVAAALAEHRVIDDAMAERDVVPQLLLLHRAVPRPTVLRRR